MMSLVLVLFISALVAGLVYPAMIGPQLEKTADKKRSAGIMILLLAGTAARILGAYLYPGHETDMNCFHAWSDMVFRDGFGAFYASESFTDYPPGYMYILYIIGFFKHIFPLSEAGVTLLLKLPAILCDGLTAWLIYRIARRRVNSSVSFMAAAFYLFNPAVFVDSALWGQVDSVVTLLILLTVICTAERRLIPAYFIFALAVFVKPQALFYTPVLLFGVIEQVLLEDFSWCRLGKNVLYALGAILLDVLLALPFGLGHVVSQYADTLASYPYATINAFNIWGAMGQNWADLTPLTTMIGYLLLIGVVAAAAYIFFKSQKQSKYYFVGAFMGFMTFMLSTKMHERYAFPAMALMLVCFIASKDWRHFLIYSLFSLSQFFNTAYVLFIYEKDPGKYFQGPAVIAASMVNIAVMVYFVYTARAVYLRDRGQEAKPRVNDQEEPLKPVFERSKAGIRLGRFDMAALAVIMAVYSGVAFYDLGDRQAPETEVLIRPGAEVRLDFGSAVEFGSVKMFFGPYHLHEENQLEFTFFDENGEKTDALSLENGDVFYWNTEDLAGRTGRYVEISCSELVSIKELALSDAAGNALQPVNADQYPALFDEQALVPERVSFRNSTYFDEIYHARTAYEFIHGLPVYEWTHPPLGKIFIAAGIMLFGMNPFGWRFVGTLFGILMIPVIYLFAKRMLKHSWLAVVTCLLFTFDFMHFAQTRIATIDVYVTFFIMLMYYFMWRYMEMSFYDTPLRRTFIPLGLSGLAMSLGIASKWTGIYAGAGLAVLFFWTIYKRFREYRWALRDPKGMTDGISHEAVIRTFKGNTGKTLLFCVGFFVLLPAAVYLLSYIPYVAAEGGGLRAIWENQQSMLTYHGKTVVESTHAYSSRWFQWPIMWRPIWYYSGTISENLKEGISSFGNPLVWWAGIPAFLYMLWIAFRHRDQRAGFLCVGYLAQLLPWTLVFRTTFIYHYFPDVPFVVLMLGYTIYRLYQKEKSVKTVAFVYAGLAVGLFVLFYPVLAGQPVDPEFVKTYLRWIPGQWVLIG